MSLLSLVVCVTCPPYIRKGGHINRALLLGGHPSVVIFIILLFLYKLWKRKYIWIELNWSFSTLSFHTNFKTHEVETRTVHLDIANECVYSKIIGGGIRKWDMIAWSNPLTNNSHHWTCCFYLKSYYVPLNLDNLQGNISAWFIYSAHYYLTNPQNTVLVTNLLGYHYITDVR